MPAPLNPQPAPTDPTAASLAAAKPRPVRMDLMAAFLVVEKPQPVPTDPTAVSLAEAKPQPAHMDLTAAFLVVEKPQPAHMDLKAAFLVVIHLGLPSIRNPTSNIY